MSEIKISVTLYKNFEVTLIKGSYTLKRHTFEVTNSNGNEILKTQIDVFRQKT
jgi:hypothetical protein